MTSDGLLEPILLSEGEGFASPFNPHPIVGTLKGSSSTGGSRCLNVRLRSSSSVLSARLLWRRPRELPLPLLPLLAPLVGRAGKPALLSLRHRQFPGLAPRGGPGSFLFLALTWGKLCFPHTPIQSSEAVGLLLH